MAQAKSDFSSVSYYEIEVNFNDGSQSQADNYTNCSWNVKGRRNGGTSGFWDNDNAGSGAAWYSGDNYVWDAAIDSYDFTDNVGQTITFKSGSFRLYHNAEGYAPNVRLAGRLTLSNLGTAQAVTDFLSIPRIPKAPTPPGTPSASDLLANEVTLTWAASSDNNGSAIDSYLLRMWEGSSATGSYTNVSSGTTRTRKVTDLEAGKTYTFAVYAHNGSSDDSNGTAGYSARSGTRTITTPHRPGSPGTPVASDVLPTSLTITFAASTDNGGSAIDNYKLRRWPNAEGTGAYVDDDGMTRTRTVTGLVPGTTYRFVTYARNASGDGNGYSAASAPLIVQMLAGGRIKVAGEYRYAIAYIRVAGEWKMVVPYVRVAGEWRMAN